MDLHEINGETLVLAHVVNVSKIFTQDSKDKTVSAKRWMLGIKVVGRESGFLYDFNSQEDAEQARLELISKLKKA